MAKKLTIKISDVVKISMGGYDWPEYIPYPGNVLFKLKQKHTYRLFVTVRYPKEENQTFLVWIDIPEGFVSDKRSAPRILWAARPRDGRSEVASLIHDALYRTAGNTKNPDIGVECVTNVPDYGTKITFSRKACDQIYKYVYGQTAPEMADEAKRDYFWLRVFGWMHFGSNKPPAARR